MKKILGYIFISVVLMAGTHPGYTQPLSNQQYGIAMLKEQISKNKNDKGTYLALCYLYSQEKEYDNMLNLMNTATSRFRNDKSILGALTEYSKDYYLEGNYNLAEKIAKLTTDKYKDDPDSSLVYAEILFKQNKPGESISFLENYIKRNPKDLIIYDKLIEMCIYKEDYNKAFKVAQEAQNVNLDNISYYLIEGLTLQLVDKDKALKYYQSYIDKLSISNDFEPRVNSAFKIIKTLQDPDVNAESYINLIKYLESQRAPLYYIVIQAQYAQKLYPENAYFSEKLKATYNK